MLKNIIGHDSVKEKLRSFKKRIPRIIIFNGPKGVGKTFTAINYINEIYSGSINIDNHPDIKVYSPEGNVFKIGTIHEIQKEIYLTPFELDKKFFILTNIDKMNKEAANASLKMFEDIPNDVHFFLTCENSENVLKTILSRSSIITFPRVFDICSHFPNISVIENSIANGCIGKISYIKENNLEEKYNRILSFFSKYTDLTYSEVLEFYAALKDIDCDILSDLFLLCSKNLADSQKKKIFLKEILDFKPKLKLNLNHDTHLKLCLVNIRDKLGEIDVPK